MTKQAERTALHVVQMRQAASQALQYVEGIDQGTFETDLKTQDAVIMKLLVIGELAAKVIDEDPEFIHAYPDVPWHKMKGMRNKMAHGYFELDQVVVWDTVRQALPELLLHLSRVG